MFRLISFPEQLLYKTSPGGCLRTRLSYFIYLFVHLFIYTLFNVDNLHLLGTIKR